MFLIQALHKHTHTYTHIHTHITIQAYNIHAHIIQTYIQTPKHTHIQYYTHTYSKKTTYSDNRINTLKTSKTHTRQNTTHILVHSGLSLHKNTRTYLDQRLKYYS